MSTSTNNSTARPDLQHASESIEAMPHQLGHRDAAHPDAIDHFPGALLEAERAAKRAHLTGLDAEQAQAASGTVNLLHRYGGTGKDNVVLVPAPTADPQGESLAMGIRSCRKARLSDQATVNRHRSFQSSSVATYCCHYHAADL
jgi:hypothetical protein